MADINRLARVVNGLPRNQALDQNTLVLDNAKLLLGSGNAANHATFSGSLTAARSILVPDADVNLGHIASLVALSGVAGGSADLGTFTGVTIADGSTIKSALQALESAIEGFDVSDKANTNLDNLVNTSIPTGVSLNSNSIVQVNDATQFEVRTVDQASSNSGYLRIRTGDTGAGAFITGDLRMVSGAATNPTITSTARATGLITLAAGAINATAGSTTGSTGNVNVLGGSITGTGTHTGNTGLLQLASGSVTNTSNTGNTGDAILVTGNNLGLGSSGVIGIRTGQVSGSGSNSGARFDFTGRSLSGSSGLMSFISGEIAAPAGPLTLNNTSNAAGSTGEMIFRSGSISNVSNTGATGNVFLGSGNHAGASVSGDVTIQSGTVGSGGSRGQVQINSGAFDVNADLNMSLISQGNAEMYSNTGTIQIYGEASSLISSNGTTSVEGDSVAIRSGVNTGVGTVMIESAAIAGESGLVTLRTGNSSANASGDLALSTGSAAANFDSGDISLATGSTSGTGVRGILSLSARHIDVNSAQIKDLADPTDAQDATTKAYVDAIAQGLSPKGSVRAATTAPVNLATDLENGDSLDGVTLATGDRVLVKNQASATANGVYVVQATGAAVRAADFDGTPSIEVKGGDWVYVEEGTANEGTSWAVLGAGSKVIDTDPINWTKINKVTPFQSGEAITISGDTVNVDIEKQSEKLTTADDDFLLIADSEDSGALKKVKKSSLLSGLNSVIETINTVSVAGNSLLAGLRALRWGRPADAETAGRMYLASNDASVSDNFYVAGLMVAAGTEVVADPIQTVSHGKLAAPSHGLTIGIPVYLAGGVDGGVTQTPPSAADTAVVFLGIPSDANTIDVSIRVVGVN